MSINKKTIPVYNVIYVKKLETRNVYVISQPPFASLKIQSKVVLICHSYEITKHYLQVTSNWF